MHKDNGAMLEHDGINMHHNKHLDTSGRPVVLRIAESRRGCQLVADWGRGAGKSTMPLQSSACGGLDKAHGFHHTSVKIQTMLMFIKLHYFEFVENVGKFITQCCSIPAGICEELFPRLILCCIPSLRSSAPAWWLCSPG
jgi:hypothetical protein